MRWLEEIRLWAEERSDCLGLDSVETYRACRVAGVVTRLRIDPRAGVIEATLTDGRACLGAQWAIDRAMTQPGMTPGSGLILEGVARIDPQGDLLMVDPAFEIVPGPRQE